MKRNVLIFLSIFCFTLANWSGDSLGSVPHIKKVFIKNHQFVLEGKNLESFQSFFLEGANVSGPLTKIDGQKGKIVLEIENDLNILIGNRYQLLAYLGDKKVLIVPLLFQVSSEINEGESHEKPL